MLSLFSRLWAELADLALWTDNFCNFAKVCSFFHIFMSKTKTKFKFLYITEKLLSTRNRKKTWQFCLKVYSLRSKLAKAHINGCVWERITSILVQTFEFCWFSVVFRQFSKLYCYITNRGLQITMKFNSIFIKLIWLIIFIIIFVLGNEFQFVIGSS